MENERFKLVARIIEVLIGSTAIAVITLFVNHSYQQRQLELAEMEMLGKFVEHAMDDSLGRRQRFAEYFEKMTTSPELAEKWKDYKEKVVQKEMDIALMRMKQLPRLIRNAQNPNQKKDLEEEFQELRRQVGSFNLYYSVHYLKPRIDESE